MKKLIIIVSTLVFFSCKNENTVGKFTLTGEIKNAPDQKIFLEEIHFSRYFRGEEQSGDAARCGPALRVSTRGANPRPFSPSTREPVVGQLAFASFLRPAFGIRRLSGDLRENRTNAPPTS